MEAKIYILLVLCYSPSIIHCLRQINDFIQHDTQDVEFLTNILFTFTSRSKLHCSTVCAQTTDCIAFTYTRATLTLGKCQGHRDFLDRRTTSESAGSKTYLLPGGSIAK